MHVVDYDRLSNIEEGRHGTQDGSYKTTNNTGTVLSRKKVLGETKRGRHKGEKEEGENRGESFQQEKVHAGYEKYETIHVIDYKTGR